MKITEGNKKKNIKSVIKMYKVICEPVKNMFGKKKGFKAIFGELEELGETKQEALINMDNALTWFFEGNSFEYPKIRHTLKRTYLLIKRFDGFEIRIIEKNGMNDHSGMMFGRVSDYQAEKQLDSYVLSCSECSGDSLLEVV